MSDLAITAIDEITDDETTTGGLDFENTVAQTTALGSLYSSGTSAASSTGGGELGKEEFMILLLTQMQNQDPLEPMDSTAMVAQLAQFSALEQMQNLNTQFEDFREQSLIQSLFVLQGQSVSIELSDGSTVEGTVDKILWSSDSMQLEINGEVYALDEIAGITLMNPQTEEEAAEAAGETSVTAGNSVYETAGEAISVTGG